MNDLAKLIDRLNGIYRIPIKDGLGAVGAGEEPDNPDEFVRKYDTSPINREAAAALTVLQGRADRLRAALDAIMAQTEATGQAAADYISMTPAATLSRADERLLAAVAEPFRLARLAIMVDIAEGAAPATPRRPPTTTVDDDGSRH